MKRFSVIIFVLVAALILFTEIINSSKQKKTSPTTEVIEPDSTINLQQVNLSTDIESGSIPVAATF
jgi:hypothetical protein